MKIIQIHPHTERRVVGRMSDGSDRQVLEVTTWHVEVEQDERVYALTFDHEPAEIEITDALAQGRGQEIVTVEIVSNRLAAAKDELLDTQAALASLYEDNLRLSEESLATMQALVALYETIGGEPK